LFLEGAKLQKIGEWKQGRDKGKRGMGDKGKEEFPIPNFQSPNSGIKLAE
jgi:hypothetical protein